MNYSDLPTRDTSFFGEWVEYRNEEEREQAINYLALWEKFFIRKLPGMKFIDNQILDRPNIFGPGRGTIGVKIFMKGKKPEYVRDLSQMTFPSTR